MYSEKCILNSETFQQQYSISILLINYNFKIKCKKTLQNCTKFIKHIDIILYRIYSVDDEKFNAVSK